MCLFCSENISFAYGFQFPTENVTWPTNGIRRASINSFGFGGTDVHVVVDDTVGYLNSLAESGKHCLSSFASPAARFCAKVSASGYEDEGTHGQRQWIFVWSAADEDGLRRLESAFAAHLAGLTNMRNPETYLQNMAYTLLSRRSSLPWKSFLVARSVKDLFESLRNRTLEPIRSTGRHILIFVFNGQGAQWHTMGQDLVNFAVFRESLAKSRAKLAAIGCTWNLFGKSTIAWDDHEAHKIQTKYLERTSQPTFTIQSTASQSVLLSRLHWLIFYEAGICAQLQSLAIRPEKSQPHIAWAACR